MAKVLVTGGAGFIGSHLVRRLHAEGHTVDVVDNMTNGYYENLEELKPRCLLPGFVDILDKQVADRPTGKLYLFEDDFASPETLKRIATYGYDVVFHLAAQPRVSYSVENPVETTDENLLKSVRLLEACRSNVKRVVVSSTCAVYGDTEIFPTPETAPRAPISPYALQKACLEDFGQMFSNLYDLDVVSLRYFNVFGPHQMGSSPYSTVISAWCNAIADKRSLRFDGDGTQTRDMVYVDNVVEANILAGFSDRKFRGECYNICTGVSTSNNEILEYLQAKFDDIDIKYAPKRPGDVMKALGDYTRAQRDFGYSPVVSFTEGLERTLMWWELV
jgi:UDP-glucose 4-epimerase